MVIPENMFEHRRKNGKKCRGSNTALFRFSGKRKCLSTFTPRYHYCHHSFMQGYYILITLSGRSTLDIIFRNTSRFVVSSVSFKSTKTLYWAIFCSRDFLLNLLEGKDYANYTETLQEMKQNKAQELD